jgi:hypothetical protein
MSWFGSRGETEHWTNNSAIQKCKVCDGWMPKEDLDDAGVCTPCVVDIEYTLLQDKYADEDPVIEKENVFFTIMKFLFNDKDDKK